MGPSSSSSAAAASASTTAVNKGKTSAQQNWQKAGAALKRSTSTAGSVIVGAQKVGGAVGSGTASYGEGYLALHGWIAATCKACRLLEDTARVQCDLDAETAETRAE